MGEGSSQRSRAAGLARTQPDEALQIASAIADAWYRAQALAWVARFAPSEIVETAFDRAIRSAADGKDSYCRAAVLAWVIRAAIERGEDWRAHAMLDVARSELPRIFLHCSRAEAASLLFQAAFAGPRRLWGPLLTEIPALCPPESHWRAGRLHRVITMILANWDGHSARRFIDGLPSGKVRRRCLHAIESGARQRARTFFL